VETEKVAEEALPVANQRRRRFLDSKIAVEHGWLTRQIKPSPSSSRRSPLSAFSNLILESKIFSAN